MKWKIGWNNACERVIMKYKCCKYLFHQIVFDIFDIKPCCETSMNGESLNILENFKSENFDIQMYIDKRQEYIDIFKQGSIPKTCSNCPIIEEKDWDLEEVYFDRIIACNIPKCSCNCTYCVYTHNNQENKKKFNMLTPYNIRPLLTELYDRNMIKEKFFLVIGGGECAEFPIGELEWLVYFTCVLHGKIQILSSGIKYSPTIAQILSNGNAELIISPDSGKKETFEKIKRVKAYNNVWRNLEKYIETAAGNHNAEIQIKYIIIPDVNDSLEEINAFLKKCKKVKCSHVHIDVEHFWFQENKNRPMPKNVKEVYHFLCSQNLNISFSAETEYWFKSE